MMQTHGDNIDQMVKNACQADWSMMQEPDTTKDTDMDMATEAVEEANAQQMTRG